MIFRRQSQILFLASFCATALAHAAPPEALGDNESLTYKVTWAILPGVGEITVNAHAASGASAKPLLSIFTHTETRGFAHLILPFAANAKSVFDVSTGRLVSLEESSALRRRVDSHVVTFNYSDGNATYVNVAQPEVKRILPMPAGFPTDLITCLVQARTWGLRPGQTHDALVLFEDQFYELTVHATGYDVVSTPLGTFTALALEPRMEKTPPKGMFKRGSRVKVWISQDARRLPVQFKVEFKVGSGVATLVAYQPPTVSAPVTAQD